MTVATTSMTGPHVTVTPDPPLPRTAVTAPATRSSASTSAGAAASRPSRPAAAAEVGARQDSRTGLCAPIGFAEGVPRRVMLADASPHALIGGPSGSGKTNLLLTMICSLAARYSPGRAGALPARLQGGCVLRAVRPRPRGTRPGCRTPGSSASTSTPTASSGWRCCSTSPRRCATAPRSPRQNEVTKLEELRAADACRAVAAHRRGHRRVPVPVRREGRRHQPGRPAARGRRPAGPLPGHPPRAGQPGRVRDRGLLGPSGDLRAVRAAHRAAAGAPRPRRHATTRRCTCRVGTPSSTTSRGSRTATRCCGSPTPAKGPSTRCRRELHEYAAAGRKPRLFDGSRAPPCTELTARR